MNRALKSEELILLTDRLTALKFVEKVETALLNVDEEQPSSRLMKYGTRRIHLRLPHRRPGTDRPLIIPEEEAQEEGGPTDD